MAWSCLSGTSWRKHRGTSMSQNSQKSCWLTSGYREWTASFIKARQYSGTCTASLYSFIPEKKQRVSLIRSSSNYMSSFKNRRTEDLWTFIRIFFFLFLRFCSCLLNYFRVVKTRNRVLYFFFFDKALERQRVELRSLTQNHDFKEQRKTRITGAQNPRTHWTRYYLLGLPAAYGVDSRNG